MSFLSRFFRKTAAAGAPSSTSSAKPTVPQTSVSQPPILGRESVPAPTATPAYCDICGATVRSDALTVVGLRQMQQAVRDGFNPYQTAAIDMSRSLAVGRAGGLSATQLFAEWRRTLMQDTTDWKLCSDCNKAFRAFMPDAGATATTNVDSSDVPLAPTEPPARTYSFCQRCRGLTVNDVTGQCESDLCPEGRANLGRAASDGIEQPDPASVPRAKQLGPHRATAAKANEHYVLECISCDFMLHIPSRLNDPPLNYSVDGNDVKLICIYGPSGHPQQFTVTLQVKDFFRIRPVPQSGQVLHASIGENIKPLHRHILSHCDPLYLIIQQSSNRTTHEYKSHPEGSTYVKFSKDHGTAIVGSINASKAEIPGVS